MVAFGVVDEVAGVDFEESGEEETGGVGEVRAGAALDLGEVGLADSGGLAAVGVTVSAWMARTSSCWVMARLRPRRFPSTSRR